MVIAISCTPEMPASMAMSFSRSARTSGSPPVMRSLLTPIPTKSDANRVISSKLSTCALDRELVALAKDFRGHAVGAPEVAPVRYGDAEGL